MNAEYFEYGCRPANCAVANSSAVACCRSGLVHFSMAVVDVRLPALLALQNDPSPCVGNSSSSSGKRGRRL